MEKSKKNKDSLLRWSIVRVYSGKRSNNPKRKGERTIINISLTHTEALALIKRLPDTHPVYTKLFDAVTNALDNSSDMVSVKLYIIGNSNFKIQAIKAVRVATNLGLKEAKDWVGGVTYNALSMPRSKYLDMVENLKGTGYTLWLV